MKLLVDIGNTRLKWATADKALVSAAPLCHHQSTDFKSTLLKQWWLLPTAPTQILISCVSKTELLQLIMTCAKELWPEIEIIIPKAQVELLGVHNAYAHPEKLGVDRWLGLLAIRQLTQQPSCIIDCGTAITIDFINAAGQHLGGVISPGLMLMKRALANGTAQLPFSEARFELGLGNNTTVAIDSGTLYAATGLIEKTVTSQKSEFKLFLTGGDATLISTELRLKITIYDDLVLQGLWCLANQPHQH